MHELIAGLLEHIKQAVEDAECAWMLFREELFVFFECLCANLIV
jgi:hypothetical protein